MPLKVTEQRGRSDDDPTSTFPSKLRVVSRHRSITSESAMYDEDYGNYIHQVSLGGKLGQNARRWTLQASAKFVDLGRLTNEALKYALFYIHYQSKYRKITPRSKTSLEQYRDVAGAAMNEESRQSKVRFAAYNEVSAYGSDTFERTMLVAWICDQESVDYWVIVIMWEWTSEQFRERMKTLRGINVIFSGGKEKRYVGMAKWWLWWWRLERWGDLECDSVSLWSRMLLG